MAEFASAGGDAAGKVYDELKAAAQEIRDSIGSNWSGNEHFELDFPKDVLVPTAFGDVDSKYRWIVDKSYQFRGAYYSHIRATRKQDKEHSSDAAKSIVKEDATSSSARKKIDEVMERTAQAKLAAKYTKKFNDVRAKVPRPEDMAPFVHHYEVKYGTEFNDIKSLSAKDFGDTVAARIVKHSSKFETKLREAAKQAELEAAMAAYKSRRPDLSEEDIRKKIAKRTMKDIATAHHRSVTLAYEVVYQVLKIDADDAAARWAKLERDIDAEARKDSAELTKQIKALMESIKEMKETLGEDDSKDMVDGFKAEMKELAAAKTKISKDLVSAKKRLEEARTRMDKEIATKRRMGPFAIYPIAEHGSLQTKIKWKNTNAKMAANASLGPEGTVRVAFRWEEDGRVGVPFMDHLLDGHYTAMGGLTFTKDGTFIAEGKMGQRFNETHSKAEIAANV